MPCCMSHVTKTSSTEQRAAPGTGAQQSKSAVHGQIAVVWKLPYCTSRSALWVSHVRLFQTWSALLRTLTEHVCNILTDLKHQRVASLLLGNQGVIYWEAETKHHPVV